jgi:hypothetical protein
MQTTQERMSDLLSAVLIYVTKATVRKRPRDKYKDTEEERKKRREEERQRTEAEVCT